MTAGNYFGTNAILGDGGFNNNGGSAETLTAFDITTGSTAHAGDLIALRWFPQITLAQYKAGALTTAGEYFGTYDPTPTGSTPDGGNQWIVPPGGLIDLSFYTTDSDFGGSQSPSTGFADRMIAEAAPEPSANALLGLGLLSLTIYFKKMRRSMSGVRAAEEAEVIEPAIEVFRHG